LQYLRIIFREADIIYDSESDYAIRQILEITQVVTYKMVHEWLYNAINPAEWEPWLNKGLATFLGICAANEVILKLTLIISITHT